MEREDVLKFTNSIVLLSKLLTKIEDNFLTHKLYEKISEFVSAFVDQKTGPLLTSHNIHNPNLLNSINNLLDYLEYLAHISESNTTPLLLAQRNLLKFKLSILKKNKDQVSSKISKKVIMSNAPTLVDVPVAINKPVRAKMARLVLKSNSNKERIFSFIKKTPDVRAKDILSEFRALSGRTVKRGLKELTDEGLLKKRSDGVAVYYLTAESN